MKPLTFETNHAGHHQQHAAHPAHDAWNGTSLAWLVLLGACAVTYLAAALRERRAGRWSGWRIAGFLCGVTLVAAASAGPIAARAHHDLRWHMVGHVLLGMLAPLGLVLAAPVTLLLRTLPHQAARRLARWLRSAPLHVLGHPFTAAVLDVGGMYLLYAAPLYALMLHSRVVHDLVHLHFLLAGCLFTWSIAGPDPAPRRPSRTIRLAALFIGMGSHALLAKLMYARGWPRGTPHDLAEIQQAAQWMYYGGDLTEVLLAAALFASWPALRRFPVAATTLFAVRAPRP